MLRNLRGRVSAFKRCRWKLFDEHCDRELSTLYFHPLDPMVLYIENFGSMLLLSASPYEPYSLRTKQEYGGTSKISMTQTEETVCLLVSELNRRKTHAVASAPGAVGGGRVWGLLQAGNTVSIPDVLTLVFIGAFNREVSENHFLPL